MKPEDETNNTVATSCSYCGRDNPEGRQNCYECGTPLSNYPAPQEEAGPRRKSKVLAVCLALIFGPLGLIYVNSWGAALLAMAIGFPFILTQTGGLWVTIGSRILCAVWAYCLVEEHDETPNERRDSLRLLDQAARLENTDLAKAIEVYEEIKKQFPNTPASREATRNIQTLTRQNGST